MPLPVRHLPVLQNWDCSGCTLCCRQYAIPVTEEERRRIVEQGWDRDPQLAGTELFDVQGPPWSRQQILNQRNGACVFLSEQGRCRIHERFGAEAKPLACRLFPFVLVAAGDHWRIGLRYACPSAAGNQGRPLEAHQSDLVQYAAALERQEGMETSTVAPPPLQGRQRVDWHDLLLFTQALLALLRNSRERLEYRWRKCLALARLCRKARFDALQGKRLAEFLNLVSGGLDGEVPVDGASLRRPSWLGRLMFRPLLAQYVRRDSGPDQGLAAQGRIALLKGGLRFGLGKGAVPRLNARMPETTFERLEEPAGALPEAAEHALERYYLTKVGSLQFCGSANFKMPFWEGLDALAVTYPCILWLARAFALDRPREEAVVQAITIVDDHFAHNPLLSGSRQRIALSILTRRDDLERLIAWYSR